MNWNSNSSIFVVQEFSTFSKFSLSLLYRSSLNYALHLFLTIFTFVFSFLPIAIYLHRSVTFLNIRNCTSCCYRVSNTKSSKGFSVFFFSRNLSYSVVQVNRSASYTPIILKVVFLLYLSFFKSLNITRMSSTVTSKNESGISPTLKQNTMTGINGSFKHSEKDDWRRFESKVVQIQSFRAGHGSTEVMGKKRREVRTIGGRCGKGDRGFGKEETEEGIWNKLPSKWELRTEDVQAGIGFSKQYWSNNSKCH